MLFAPESVSISGQAEGLTEQDYLFTGVVFPITTTLPVTYTWQATDQIPQTFTGGITSTIIYTWATPGSKVITLTANNDAATINDVHTILIQNAIRKIYLPTIIS